MNLKKFKSEVFSIPNVLSYIRILLIPVFIAVFVQAVQAKDSSTATILYIVSTVVVMISGLTDLLDGVIARRFNMITQLGKVLDPVADKLTSIAMVACLCLKFDFMIWLLALYLFKECAMMGGGLFLIKKGVKIDGARWFGKLATMIFYVTMFFLVAVPTESGLDWLIKGCVILNVILMLFAFLMYIPVFFKLRGGKPAKEIKQ